MGRWLLVLLVACAPSVEGPSEKARANDRADAIALENQLAHLPGAQSASVAIRRPARDPLSTQTPPPPTGSALVVVAAEADRARITERTKALWAATAPEIAQPTIVVEVGTPPPKLASVGPFTVEQSSGTSLRIALAVAFVLIVGLAGLLARATLAARKQRPVVELENDPRILRTGQQRRNRR